MNATTPEYINMVILEYIDMWFRSAYMTINYRYIARLIIYLPVQVLQWCTVLRGATGRWGTLVMVVIRAWPGLSWTREAARALVLFACFSFLDAALKRDECRGGYFFLRFNGLVLSCVGINIHIHFSKLQFVRTFLPVLRTAVSYA